MGDLTPAARRLSQRPLVALLGAEVISSLGSQMTFLALPCKLGLERAREGLATPLDELVSRPIRGNASGGRSGRSPISAHGSALALDDRRLRIRRVD